MTVTNDLPTVAILAGGLATRLRPATTSMPKALLELAGEPFIAHQLRLLESAGIHRVVLCVGHLGNSIQAFVGDGRRFGLRVEYSFDGPRLLGTAGALRQASGLLGDHFFVLYGDSYLPCDYRAINDAFSAAGKPALMTVYRNENAYDRSNVELVNGTILRYNVKAASARMRHIDYGLGVLSSSVLSLVPPGEACGLSDLYRSLVQKGLVAAYEVQERFYEIGSWRGLEELRGLMARGLIGA